VIDLGGSGNLIFVINSEISLIQRKTRPIEAMWGKMIKRLLMMLLEMASLYPLSLELTKI
jgi:hypothetical protein